MALSPMQNQGGGRSRVSSTYLPSKQSHIRSPSRSRSRSRSPSPSRHRKCHHTSPDYNHKNNDSRGRRGCATTGSRKKGGGSNPSFFQGGTAVCGSSACVVCLGCHEHDYAKCDASKPGMGERPVYEGTNVGGLSSSTDYHFVSASRPWQGAQTHPTPLDTSARGAESRDMVPNNVLRHRRTEPLTPYKLSMWHSQLDRHGLLEKYPNLHHSLMHGFNLGIPSISRTYVPANNPSINKLPAEYEEIVEKEFQKG